MKLLELTDWQELMKQSAWTIDFWYGQAEKLGIEGEAEKLKYAELCMKEYENSAKLRIVDEVLGLGDRLLERVDDLTEALDK